MKTHVRIKNTMKIIIDIVMTVVLMFLMSYMLAGPQIHEWLGCVMFVLFIVHHFLNYNWHRNLFRGKYTGYRILLLVINLFIFVGMFVSMITGIILSRYVFSWMDIRTGVALARKYHMLAAYWNFVLLSVHLGLHWSQMIGMMKKLRVKAIYEKKILSLFIWTVRIIAFVLAIYGGYKFINEGITQYLFGKINFTYYDFRQSIFQYVLNYMMIMESIVFLVYYIRKIIVQINVKRI